MKKLSLYVFLVLMFCNVGFANDNDLTGIKLLCKETRSSKWLDIPFRTYEFINDFEISRNSLKSKELKITSRLLFYKADIRNVYLYYSKKKYEGHRKDGRVIERDTLNLLQSQYKGVLASCSVVDKDTDLKKILQNELEIIKSKILEKNKI